MKKICFEELIKQAVSYANRGWPVFPCDKKIPLTANGFKDATKEEAQIRVWWNKWPLANIGIATGSGSGLIVVDIDPRHGGDESFLELEKQCGGLPKTVESLTGGGGRHLFFACSVPMKNKANILPGIDIRADGGYIIAPPSVHENGQSYEWELSHHPDEIPFAPLPECLQSFLTKTVQEKPPHAEEKISEGSRNSYLTSLAGVMRRRNASEEAIFQALRQENVSRCSPPLDESEVQKIASSISRYEPLKDGATNIIEPIPVIRIQDIEAKQIEWLVHGILAKNSITIMSGQPGSFKSWLALELGLSVSMGQKALGCFEVQKGKVLHFNAEDDPAVTTKNRLEALVLGKGVGEEEDFWLLDTPSLMLDDVTTQKRLEKTVEAVRPTLLILDPFRNLHTQDEDKSSSITPILNFLRELNRKYSMSILAVFHDRKPKKEDPGRRASRIRGSNAVEGWRDSAIFLDVDGGQVHVELYHRSSQAMPPFDFTLTTSNQNDTPHKAELKLTGGLAMKAIESLITEAVRKTPGITKTQLSRTIHKNKQEIFNAIKAMLARGELAKGSSGGLVLGTSSGTGSDETVTS
jgi:hypothetical protein